MRHDRTIVLFDTEANHRNLLPLSYTRPVSDFRVGITTIRRKWETLLPGSYVCHPVEYLREKFGGYEPEDPACEALFISGSLLPYPEVVKAVDLLQRGEALMDGDEPVAFRGTLEELEGRMFMASTSLNVDARIRYVFDVFLRNSDMLRIDYAMLTHGRTSCAPGPGCVVIGPAEDAQGRPMVFIEEGASVQGAFLNTTEGPIYVGREAQVMEGSCLRGPLGLCRKSKVKMGAKVYGGTTLGPYCKVGGEIDNVVMFGFSNKAHDGYLGSAVIGEWCNIGAGTNASNLKNDYSKIRIWNYAQHTFMRTNLQFCGLIMGDHSKAGVNCMFNTATVVGVGVNVHGAGFPRVFLPSFMEGSATAGFTHVPMKKFLTIAERVMARRGVSVSDGDRRIFDKVYEISSAYK